MKRALAALVLLGPAAIVACSLVRSLDGYSDLFGVDAGDASPEGGCPTCLKLEVLADNQASPHGVAVNATHFYWTNEGDGTVRRCAIAGCNGTPDLVARDQATPTQLTLNDYDVVWANADSGPGVCYLPPCTAPFGLTSGDAGTAVAVAVSDLLPYWTTTGGAVYTCPSCGVIGAGPTPITTGQAEPRGIVVAKTSTATSPFWAARGSGSIMTCADKLCKDDAGPTVFAPNQGSVDVVAADGNAVYWANDAVIRSCPLAGCSADPQTIADGQDHPRGLAIDDARVYWTNGDGTIRACPKNGCPAGGPTTLAVGQDDPQEIAVTTTAVYWVSRAKGTVVRAAKQ